MTRKEQFVSFLWQHVLLLISLCVMTLGVAVCVRSMLGVECDFHFAVCF